MADTTISGSITLEVKENYVDSVKINSENIELDMGNKKTLTAQIETVGTVAEEEKNITWSSDQPDIASINETTGVLEAKTEGIALIRATAGGVNSMPISLKVLFIESVTLVITYNNKEYRANKILDVNADENSNIVNIFIDEHYNTNQALKFKLTPTLPDGWTTSLDTTAIYNFSDQTAEIFEISDGITTGKFRLHIFRKPILVDKKPAGNIEKSLSKDDSGNKIVIELEDEYETSGATAVSIRKFVQTDYYYVPTVINGKPSNLPAPTFALFSKDANPTQEAILSSPVRILRNFSTSDGNTLFFSSVDDGIEDDDWDVRYPFGGTAPNLNPVADLLFSLSPSTDYSLHWAVEASNGKFSGSLRTVSTAALPTGAPTTGTDEIKYFGVGGMKAHPVEGLNFRVPSLLISNAALQGKKFTQWTGQGSDLVTGGFRDVEGIAAFYNAYDPVSGIYAVCYGLVATHNGAFTYVWGGNGVRTEYGFTPSIRKIIELE